MPKHDQMIWQTEDGRRLKIVDMTDRHVINCVKYFRRRERSGTEDDSVCQVHSQSFSAVLLEGKTRGIIETNLTFSKLLEFCKLI